MGKLPLLLKYRPVGRKNESIGFTTSIMYFGGILDEVYSLLF